MQGTITIIARYVQELAEDAAIIAGATWKEPQNQFRKKELKIERDTMRELHNLEDLFYHQLRDIYSAEKQLVDALPKLVEEAASSKLKAAFAEHLEETKEHKKRLEQIGELLGIDLKGETREAMKGLIKETNSLISERAEPEVRDAGLIADAQRIEHYEISAYGTAVTYAQTLNYVEAAGKLQITLDEESVADEKLNGLAIDIINPRAKEMEAKPWH